MSIFYRRDPEGRKKPRFWIYIAMFAIWVASTLALLKLEKQRPAGNPDVKPIYSANIETKDPGKILKEIRLPVDGAEGTTFKLEITISGQPPNQTP